MLNYYRSAFIKLAELLNKLDPNTKEAAIVCYEIQCELIPRIRRVESRIRHWKNIKPQTEETQNKIMAYQRLNQTLRYFGDAIAFTFTDRWDIKPMSMGNTAGFISGKVGFRLEKGIMKHACEKGVPAILTDLTNWLRHGDVLLFPPNQQHTIIVEAKNRASKKSGRANRQKKRLKKLTDYLKTDAVQHKENTIYRVSLHSEIIDHSKAMSKIASKAYKNGTASEIISDGLIYFAMCEFDEELFETMGNSFLKPICIMITSDQYYRHNYPYYPITLVIEDATVLSEFLSANMVLGVLLDFSKLSKCIESRGSTVKLLKSDENDPWALDLKLPNGKIAQVSKTMFGRLFFEFLDVDWFAEAILTIQQNKVSNSD